MVKRALVLSGGGSKGAFQVGVLKALLEAGNSWHSVHGISVGALNASWIAMFKPEDQPGCFPGLLDIWDNVKTSADIYKPWAPAKLHYVYSMMKGSLNSGAPLRKIVEGSLDADKLWTSGVKMTVGCVSLTTGQYVAIDSSVQNIKEYILASSHLPLVFEPLEIDGEQWVDGGIRHQIPILEALKERPDEIDVILTSPVSEERVLDLLAPLTSAPKVALRSSEILADQIYINDYFTVSRVIRMGKIKIRVFAPSAQPNPDSMDFDGELIQTAIEMGYTAAKAELELEDE